MNVNKVIIIGNLTKSPELKALSNGMKIANFGVATNRSWKDKEGAKKEEVEFHNVVSFGKTAEILEQWFKKGDQIYLEGRLKTSTWEKDGAKHYKTEIVLENFQFGAKRGVGSSKKENDTEAVDGGESVATGQNSPNTGNKEDMGDTVNPSDIPF